VARAELTAGHVVGGRYTVGKAMPSSGRVATYAAVTAAGREVVLKLYDPELGDPVLMALRRALEITRDLPRGSALEVLEVAVDMASGATFIATERSARPSLAHLVELCPLLPAEASALARNLARALAGAHEHGLAHLALKPTNVFVGAAPACEVRLADFASTVARGAIPGSSIEQGLLPWLAPEQVFGVTPPGVLSDVFSAALVVFFALTGRSYWRCFPGEPNPAAWSREVWGTRLPASVRAAELASKLPRSWDAPFARALEVEPERRYPSVGELAEAFARAAQDEEVSSSREISRPRIRPIVVPSASQFPRDSVPPISLHTSAFPPPPLEAQPTGPPVPVALPAPVLPTRPGSRGRTRWVVAGIVMCVALVAGSLGVPSLARHGIRLPVLAGPTPPGADPPSPPEPTPAPCAMAPVATRPPASAPLPDVPVPAAPAGSPPAALSVDPQHALIVITCKPSCDSV
jgi:serine/threonine protein kinase